MRIIIEPYNPAWPAKFTQIKDQIAGLLGGDTSVDHIGSTSVPSLAAKPVIDILIGAKDQITLDSFAPKMIKTGFTYVTKYDHLLPGRRYFVRYGHPQGIVPPEILDESGVMPHGFINTVHMHSWVYGSPDWTRHIAFRDYLRVHQPVRMEYQQLKTALAFREWDSMQHYSEAKNDFIKIVEAKAIEWYTYNV